MGGLLCGRLLVQAEHLGWQVFAGDGRLHAVDDALGKHIGPLRDSSLGNADSLSHGPLAATEQTNGCFLVHGTKLSTLIESRQARLVRKAV